MKKLKLADGKGNTQVRRNIKAKDLTKLYPDADDLKQAVNKAAQKIIHQHSHELNSLANK